MNAVVDLNARNSTSLQRAPAGRDEFVRGSRKNVPFLPGGIEANTAPVHFVAPRMNLTLEICAEPQPTADLHGTVRFLENGSFAPPTKEEMVRFCLWGLCCGFMT